MARQHDNDELCDELCAEFLLILQHLFYYFSSYKSKMPSAARAARAKAKLAAAELLRSQSRDPNKTELTTIKAAALVDKNSRTIMKLSQLLAIYNKPGASEKDEGGLVAKKIESYKQRISRRLVILAKVIFIK